MQQRIMPLQTAELTWQQELASAFNNISALCQHVQLSPETLNLSTAAQANFALRVPQSFANLIEKGNPDDPLLRQVLPLQDELEQLPGYSNDPVGDLQAISSTGVLHKYHGRVLFITTGSCAINCRYCFRRNFPYSDNQLSRQQQATAIDYVRNDSSINEVILSGGDPLLLSDSRLGSLMQQFKTIAHIQRIRIHSRIPVVLPSRMNEQLSKLLIASEKHIILVIHSNHANEISPQLQQVCQQLRAKQITLFNQSVLLRGINDQAQTLIDLSNALFNAGVLPYYLHMLDKAHGSGHFSVSEEKAIALMQEIQTRLPGYLLPKLVREEAGALSKLPLHY